MSDFQIAMRDIRDDITDNEIIPLPIEKNTSRLPVVFISLLMVSVNTITSAQTLV